MTRLTDLDAVCRLYAERGHEHYGEGVTLLEHSLQSAHLAEADGAPPSLVAAALLHDIGHLLAPDDPEKRAMVDARHERSGELALAHLFSEAVRAPIRLHVCAKRYLCFRDPGYLDLLSEASRASLRLQGGPFSTPEAAAFERESQWREAVALRRYDDLAKQSEPCGRVFENFVSALRQSAD